MKNILLKTVLIAFIATCVNPIKAESSFDYYFPKVVMGLCAVAAAAFVYFGWLNGSSTSGDSDKSTLNNKRDQQQRPIIVAVDAPRAQNLQPAADNSAHGLRADVDNSLERSLMLLPDPNLPPLEQLELHVVYLKDQIPQEILVSFSERATKDDIKDIIFKKIPIEWGMDDSPKIWEFNKGIVGDEMIDAEQFKQRSKQHKAVILLSDAQLLAMGQEEELEQQKSKIENYGLAPD